MYRKDFFLGALVVLVIIGAAAYALSRNPDLSIEQYVETRTTSEQGEREQRRQLVFTDESFSIPEINAVFSVADSWKQTTLTAAQVPADLMRPEDIRVAFVKEGTTCAFTYGKLWYLDLERYPESSFAERVFTQNNEQIDSHWYIDGQKRPENFAFLWDGEQPLPHEVRIVYYPYSQVDDTADVSLVYAFALFDTAGGAVDRACDHDVSDMLSSLERKPKPFTGEVRDGAYFMLTYSWGEDAKPYQFFIPQGSDESLAVSQVAIPWNNALFYKQRLYFISEKGFLIRMNPFTGQTEQVPGITYTNQRMVTFTFIDGDLYYTLDARIEDSSCGDYRGKCDSTLYRYQFEKVATPEALATGVSSSVFLGKDPAAQKIYLEDGWGDAGCVSYKVESYDLLTGTLQKEPTRDASGCYDESAEDTAALDAYRRFVDSLRFRQDTAMYLQITNGVATPVADAPDIIETPTTFSYIVE